MGVGIEALFTSALGLQEPWSVEKVELDTARRRIDFELTCKANRLTCPHCQAAGQGVHDRLKRQWRHLDFFQYEAWLHAQVPRIACTACGKTTQMEVPWAREGSGFTALFEALALSLCQTLPVRQAAALLRCADKALWRRIEYYVNQARALDDMSTVRTVGIDETSLRKGQNYITVVHDLDAKRLLFACEGRDHQSVVDFAADLKAHAGDPAQIEHVCQDMSAAYAKGVALALPNAQISYDRFHVIAMANEAMDGVRRQEMSTHPQAIKEALGDNDRKLLKSLAWYAPQSRGLERQANQRDALAAALHAQECAGVAPEDGTARGLRQCSGGQRQGACQQGIEGLAELGAAQPPGAVPQTGQDLERTIRGGRARDAGQSQQRLCGGHERLAAAGQASCQGIQNRQKLHCHRVLAHVQAQAFAAQSAATSIAAG